MIRPARHPHRSPTVTVLVISTLQLVERCRLLWVPVSQSIARHDTRTRTALFPFVSHTCSGLLCPAGGAAPKPEVAGPNTAGLVLNIRFSYFNGLYHDYCELLSGRYQSRFMYCINIFTEHQPDSLTFWPIRNGAGNKRGVCATTYCHRVNAGIWSVTQQICFDYYNTPGLGSIFRAQSYADMGAICSTALGKST